MMRMQKKVAIQMQILNQLMNDGEKKMNYHLKQIQIL